MTAGGGERGGRIEFNVHHSKSGISPTSITIGSGIHWHSPKWGRRGGVAGPSEKAPGLAPRSDMLVEYLGGDFAFAGSNGMGGGRAGRENNGGSMWSKRSQSYLWGIVLMANRALGTKHFLAATPLSK